MTSRNPAAPDESEACKGNEKLCRTVLQILDRIGDKWTVMVVGALAEGALRFSAILRQVDGISHRMLTITLRGLQQDGLVERRAFATTPPKVEYELTPLGRSLIEPLYKIAEWAEANQDAIEAARAASVQRRDETAQVELV